jgi:hypothetical protein
VNPLSEHARLLTGLLALVLATGCGPEPEETNTKPLFEIHVSDREIVFDGTITAEAYEQLVALLDVAETSPDRLTITSGGGDSDAGLDFGFLVHERGLTVHVPTYCGSSCANYVFTAAKAKLLGERASLMWHGGATQAGLREPPPCVEGEWYENSLDCDPAKYSEIFDPIIDQWLEKETRFFDTIGVDQRITVLGQDPEFRCGGEDADGWYYSLADLERLGVRDVQLLGDRWEPIPPKEDADFCRVDLAAMPDRS